MNSLTRRAANRLVGAAAALFPAHMSSWPRAMARELSEISDDGAALRFAFGCVRAAVVLAVAAHFQTLRGQFLQPSLSSSRRLSTMNHLLDHPRSLGLLCAAGAVGLGLAYMAAAGAPQRYLLVNLAALVLGATAWLALSRAESERLSGSGVAVLALALPLLGTAFFGLAADGAARWVSVGGLGVQVSLVLLPPMLILYASRPDRIGTLGMAVAALALAAQPDRAMAGVLAAGLAGLALCKPGRLPALAMLFAAAAFGATLLVPDLSPAVPFVDRIIFTAFDVHALAGSAVVAGCFLLLVPALPGARPGAEQRHVMLAFGGCWAGIVAAAALGNYPTPLVGYSGSAVLGYLLSVALLPRTSGNPLAAGQTLAATEDANGDASMKFIMNNGPDTRTLVPTSS